MDKLIYKKQAKHFKRALPLGNGHMGIMVYGGKKVETITVNDGTLWSGYPRDFDNSESAKNLDAVRKLIFEGKNAEADNLAKEKLIGDYGESFMPLGRIRIAFASKLKKQYCRMLDLSNAIHTVCGVGVQREAFVSYPDKVAVYHIESDERQVFCVQLDSQLKSSVVTDDTITLVGNAPDYVAPNYLRLEKYPIRYNEGKGMAFAMRVDVVTDGEKSIENGRLIVRNATKTSIYFVTATGYVSFDKMPITDTKQMIEKCTQKLNAIDKNYELIKKRHVEDYTAIYNKQSLNLGKEIEITTDKLVKNAKSNKIDVSLVELLYNYGKYMTIAGSRKGGQALNLQGIWNESTRPPWSSNYTININTEMNYWGASAANLDECIEPLINMVYETLKRGEKTAKINYNARGFACNHNVDLWRKTCPVLGSPSYMFAPLCSVWLANELFEHLSYGNLEEYKDKILEIVQKATLFAVDFLVEHNGYYVTCPSASPENKFFHNNTRCCLDYSSSFDLALIKQCFTNYLSINDNDSIAQEVKEKLSKLHPFTIGKDGINEWHKYYETPERGHRHFSPLYGFHPARVIGYHKDKELTEAVHKLFSVRVENIKHYYGWSGAWAISIAARLHDSKMCAKVIGNVLSHSIFSNLFGMHPPFLFQIDGNFGFVSGINEILVGVEDGIIELLPALPQLLSEKGSVKGMRTITGHTIDFEWQNGIVTEVAIKGKNIAKLRKTSTVMNTKITGQVELV